MESHDCLRYIEEKYAHMTEQCFVSFVTAIYIFITMYIKMCLYACVCTCEFIFVHILKTVCCVYGRMWHPSLLREHWSTFWVIFFFSF